MLSLHSVILGVKRYKTFPMDVLVDLLKGPVLLLLIPSLWYGIGSIGNFTVRELFLYTAASHLVVLLPLYVSFPVQRMIRSGQLQAMLTKPIDVGVFLLLRNLGGTLVSLFSSLLTFLWIYTNFGGVNIHLYLLGVLLTIVFYLLLGEIIGYLSTWFYTIWGFQSMLVYLPSLLFGGSLIPLDLLPEWIVEVSSFLPWKNLHYDVAMIVLGKEPNFLPLIVWIGILAIFERVVFKLMVRTWEQWGG